MARRKEAGALQLDSFIPEFELEDNEDFTKTTTLPSTTTTKKKKKKKMDNNKKAIMEESEVGTT